MDLRRLIAELASPAAYPHPAETVIVHQTHISVVFLAGPYAYKIKKPVNLGYLDFATLASRRHFCNEECRLNQRLAPQVYLGVVPVVEHQKRLRVDGAGEAVEWAVKMVRLDEADSLLAQLQRGETQPADMERLAEFLVHFHRTADRSERITAFGRFVVVAGNARENFAQARKQIGITCSDSVFERVRERTEHWLERLRPRIESRAARGVPCDTHGDLHLDHVYLNAGSPFAIDCIEFNERFRYADPVADLAFLVMDLKYRGRADLAAVLIEAYVRAADDDEGRALLPFYTAYRAVVRAKVDGVKAREAEVPERDRHAAMERAKGYWLLALGELEEPGRRPALVLVGGLPGTGKSTLAQELAEHAGFTVIRSDVVRKELAGAAPLVRLTSDCYSQEWNDRTYAECQRRAETLLYAGRRVLIDATFREDRQRLRMLDLAQRLSVPAVVFVCEASPEVVQQRLAARVGDASDADWRVHQQAAENWEAASSRISSILQIVRTDPGGNSLEGAVRVLRERGLME